jgi:hypothetical protein
MLIEKIINSLKNSAYSKFNKKGVQEVESYYVFLRKINIQLSFYLMPIDKETYNFGLSATNLETREMYSIFFKFPRNRETQTYGIIENSLIHIDFNYNNSVLFNFINNIVSEEYSVLKTVWKNITSQLFKEINLKEGRDKISYDVFFQNLEKLLIYFY